MSWDVALMRLPEGVTALDELDALNEPDELDERDDGAEGPALGPRSQVLDTVHRVLPELDRSDPTWWVLEGPTWSIELPLASPDDPVRTLGLLVRGSGDDVMEPIFRLAEALDCRVYDTTQGDLLSGRDDVAGWHLFQHMRDKYAF